MTNEYGRGSGSQSSRTSQAGSTGQKPGAACPPDTIGGERTAAVHRAGTPENTATMGSAAGGPSYGTSSPTTGQGAGRSAADRTDRFGGRESSPTSGSVGGESQHGAKAAAAHMTDEARRRAAGVADKARQQAAEVADEARAAAREVGDAASETASQFRSRAVESASEQKGRLAEELSHFGSAMRCAADRLHEEQDHRVAHYAELAAEQIDSGVQYLRSRDVRGLVGDVERFARRRPDIFLGALFIGGLAVSRFLKASASH